MKANWYKLVIVKPYDSAIKLPTEMLHIWGRIPRCG